MVFRSNETNRMLMKSKNGRMTEMKRVPMNLIGIIDKIQDEITNGNTWTCSAELLGISIEKEYRRISSHARRVIDTMEEGS